MRRIHEKISLKQRYYNEISTSEMRKREMLKLSLALLILSDEQHCEIRLGVTLWW